MTLAGYRHRTDTPLARIKVYAKGGLGFLEPYGKEYQYEAVLESILAELPGKPKYVIIVSGGNDVYGPKKTVYEEEYQDVLANAGLIQTEIKHQPMRLQVLSIGGFECRA